MITICIHRESGVVTNHVPLKGLHRIVTEPKDLLWVDVVRPTDEDIEVLREEFGFHALALEDVMRQHQRPKIDSYDDYVFLIFYALLVNHSHSGSLVRTAQIGIFVGRNFIVTIHQEPLSTLDAMSARWQQNVDIVGQHSLGLLLYSILDAIVDGYFPVVDTLSDRIEQLEDRIFGPFDREAQQEIFRLKRDMLAIRRAISPERDVMNVLVRRDTPIFDPGTLIYLQDVYDHILRVTDAVDTYRDLLSGALDAYLSVASNRLNQVMRTLTASSIILMSMTLIASIYGMNFIRIPELSWHYGYAWALGLMAAIGISLFMVFKHIDWL